MISYNDLAGKKISRIEALSDGVFAIALTLLVLEIKVPDLSAHSEKEVISLFCRITPKLLTYLLSFMTMGIFWNGQAVQLSYMKDYDRDLTWNSLFFLLLVSVLPFSTAFLGAYIGFRFALGLYWLNILLLGLLLYIHWHYACRKNVVDKSDPQFTATDKAIRRRIVVAQVLYFLGALCCFINTYLSIALIILIQLNYAFAIVSGKSEKRQKNKKHAISGSPGADPLQ